MREFDHTVRSVVGLHPRVAGVMMHLVRDFESDVVPDEGGAVPEGTHGGYNT